MFHFIPFLLHISKNLFLKTQIHNQYITFSLRYHFKSKKCRIFLFMFFQFMKLSHSFRILFLQAMFQNIPLFFQMFPDIRMLS